MDPSAREDRIRFVVNGTPVAVSGVPPTLTLLQWLRYERRLVGTKEGCAEGDCGACTVAVRDRAPDGRLVTRAINACIALLPMMHGREIVTVEHLAREGGLHPVQRALVAHHGSQCGFCTPGFVMSLWAARASEPAPPSEGRIEDILAGNLCRCTGYGPIVAGARDAFAAPRPPDERADEDAAPDRLAAIGEARLDYVHAGRRFIAPTDLDDLAAAIAAHPEATILSGATDVGLWVTKNDFDPETIVYTGRCRALAAIARDGDAIVLGAGALHEDARAAVAGPWPDMGELLRRFGGNQVRAAGTVGGNVANGSPIGDWPPALIAADATLVLRKGAARRAIPLEDFFVAYGEQDRAPGEFVEAIRVPLPAPGTIFRAYKVSKRFDSDITAVLACLSLVPDAGGRIAAARIAFGGMAATPKRARAAEAALLGRRPDEAAFEAAAEALAADFTPITDMRASAGYRMEVARNLMRRAAVEIARPDAPTRLAGTLTLVA